MRQDYSVINHSLGTRAVDRFSVRGAGPSGTLTSQDFAPSSYERSYACCDHTPIWDLSTVIISPDMAAAAGLQRRGTTAELLGSSLPRWQGNHVGCKHHVCHISPGACHECLWKPALLPLMWFGVPCAEARRQ